MKLIIKIIIFLQLFISIMPEAVNSLDNTSDAKKTKTLIKINKGSDSTTDSKKDPGKTLIKINKNKDNTSDESKDTVKTLIKIRDNTTNNAIYYNLIRSNNKNITKAISFLKEKKYNDALSILSDELVRDKKNEDLIMKLISDIEQEKKEVIALIYSVKEKIKSSEFVKAEEIIKEFEKTGQFDIAIDKVINLVQQERGPLEKINKFNTLVTVQAEKYLLEYDIENALKCYTEAMNIFRPENPKFNDMNFTMAVNKFNAAEKDMLNSNISKDLIDKNLTEITYGRLAQNNKIINNTFSDWKKIEADFFDADELLDKSQKTSKAMIEYEAYKSITEKYLFALNRSIQKNSRIQINYIFNLIDKDIESLKSGNKEALTEIINTKKLMADLEKTIFYNNTINLMKSYLIPRSKKNILSYLDFITRKNSLDLKIEEAKIISDFTDFNNKYAEYSKYYEDKSLYDADKSLKESLNIVNSIKPRVDNLTEIIAPYKGIKADEFVQFNQKIASFNEQIKNETDRINKSADDLNSKITYVNVLLDDANKLFNTSVTNFNVKRYDIAKENFTDTKTKYIEITGRLKSEYVDRQLDKVDEYLNDLDQIIFRQDIKKAEDHLEKAIQYLYTEKFEEAKKEMDETEMIYERYKDNEKIYKENSEIIKYYRERILTAIKMKTSSKLTIDDQSYEEITELMKNANKYYEQSQYDKAKNTITQVLLEKPYYEDARIFEVKLLLKTDPKNFEEIYNNYFNDAKAKFDRGLFEQALISFEQLLKFEKNLNVIKNYITECKKKLGLIKPEITAEDRAYAQKLVAEANANYANKNYQEAYNKANLALNVWPNVAKARDIREAARQRINPERPKLTRENEIKYRQAEKAYADGNFDLAFNLTADILRTQDFDYVRQLNKQADIRRTR